MSWIHLNATHLEYRELKLSVVKWLERRERLNELDGVLPLTVEDQLPEEEEVVGEAAVDHARLALQGHLLKEEVVFGRDDADTDAVGVFDNYQKCVWSS